MKILHVITSLLTGGAEKLIVDIVPRLREKGHVVDVAVFNGIKTPFLEELQKNKEVEIDLLCKSFYDVRYILKDAGMRYHINSPAKEIHAHILLPEGAQVKAVMLNGRSVKCEISVVGSSRYVDFSARHLKGIADIELVFLN